MEEVEPQIKREMLMLRDFDALRSKYGDKYGNVPTAEDLRTYFATSQYY